MEGRSAWCAFEGRIILQVCFVSSILLSLSFSSQVECPPPRLKGPGRPTGVLPTNPPPRPLAHVRVPKVQRLVQVQVHQVLALLLPEALSSRRCPLSLCPSSFALLLIYD